MACYRCGGPERTGDDGYAYCAQCNACLGLPSGTNSKLLPKGDSDGNIALATDIRGSRNVEVMDQATPANRKLHLLLKSARWGARSLPREIDFWLLLYPYLAEQRGDGLPAEGFEDAFPQRVIAIKEQIERRAREFRLSLQEFGQILDDRNVFYLLDQNPKLMLHEALERVLRMATGARALLAPSDELDAAEARLRGHVVRWLRRWNLPFSIRPSITIPATTLQNLLSRLSALPDIFVGAAIPPQKLLSAVQVVGIPDDDNVSALIDCTFFGSAKDCVLIGSKAIYYRNHGIDNFLPYSEFPDITFYPQENGVCCGDIAVISLAGSGFPAVQLANLLDTIKSEALKREVIESTPLQDGLIALPGMTELKQMLLEEVVEPLRNPDEFRKYKIDIPNGILMYGPPGCGKTFVAQKLAAELNYNFYEISPSAVGSMYVHGSVLKIRELFEEAANQGPALMFVDEFEGMVPSRRDLASTDQYKSEEVNEWLVQIGNCATRRILFVAATNEPWKIDDAVQRSGRLDKKVYVGPPDQEAIVEMLMYHLKGRPHCAKEGIREFAGTIAGQGYAASDLKLMVDEAAKFAMKDRSDIGPKHLMRAAAERVRPSIPASAEEAYQQVYAR